jgi:perosamine synthetase
MNIFEEKSGRRNPGCLTRLQVNALREVLAMSEKDPSVVSDLEGCGPIARMEEAFANFSGSRYALALSSGTGAVHAALLASGVGPGDEVIVTPYSWPQSVGPVLFTGATPVFADIDPYTFNLDPESVATRVSAKTRAIIPVHLFGHVADIPRLQEIANHCGATLIVDAAHAMGAMLNGVPIGALGDIVCFSLGRGKLVSGGEGGILTTNNTEIFEKALCLTQHEERVKRWFPASRRPEMFSLNYRLHPLTAILALADLNVVRSILDHRESIFNSFWGGLGKQSLLLPQKTTPHEKPAPYGIPLTFHGDFDRGRFALAVHQKGVPLRCGPIGNPLHFRLQKRNGLKIPFHDSHLPGSCPVAEERCAKRELIVLSGLDMDGVSPEIAFSMGELIRNELQKNRQN